jgi:cell pole-organizing protein PopZ
MAVTEKNGQASMEEILASIRRIIAEEPAGAVPLIDLNRKSNGRPAAEGDDGDFELPSMFRHRRPSLIEGRQPLYGRLTDALRQAAPAHPKEQTNGRAVPAANVKTARPATVNAQTATPQTTPAQAFGSRPQQMAATPTATLSELTPRRESANGAAPSVNGPAMQNGSAQTTAQQHHNGQTPSSVSQAAPGQVNGSNTSSGKVNGSKSAAHVATPVSPAASAVKSSTEQQPRVMAPFRDVRMSGMGAMTNAANPPAEPTPSTTTSATMETAAAKTPEQPASDIQPGTPSTAGPSPNGVDFSTIVPLQMGLPGRQAEAPVASETAAPDTTAAAQSSASVASGEAAAEAPVAAPPPLPAEETAPANGRIEDATADLLRPMLRQWLAENMPRMVEKALHIEVAQSVQLTDKPGQN